MKFFPLIILFYNNRIPIPTTAVSEDMDNITDSMPKVNYNCSTSSDCIEKNVGNCCGAYMECVNKDFEQDKEALSNWCQQNEIFGICGWTVIDFCVCEDGRCMGGQVDGSETGSSSVDTDTDVDADAILISSVVVGTFALIFVPLLVYYQIFRKRSLTTAEDKTACESEL